MSEDTEVITAPSTGDAAGETTSTAAEPVSQDTAQSQSVASEKVVPDAPTSSNRGYSKPSFFSSTREKLSQYELKDKERSSEIAQLKELISKIQAQNAPATPEQFIFNSDDDIYKEGLTNSLKKFEQYMMEKTEKRFQEKFGDYYGSYQENLKAKTIEEERQIANEDVAERINKMKESGADAKLVEILRKYPALDNASRGDPIKAKEILDFIESEYLKDANKTPLAPKKSRMGMIGSGSPIGGSQGKPNVDQVRVMKEKLESEFSEKHNDPEFKKQWETVKELYSQIIENK